MHTDESIEKEDISCRHNIIISIHETSLAFKFKKKKTIILLYTVFKVYDEYYINICLTGVNKL